MSASPTQMRIEVSPAFIKMLLVSLMGENLLALPGYNMQIIGMRSKRREGLQGYSHPKSSYQTGVVADLVKGGNFFFKIGDFSLLPLVLIGLPVHL